MRVTVRNAGDLTLDDGSKLCVHANQAYDLPEKMAKAMIKGGSAHKGEPKRPDETPKPEAKKPGTTPAESEPAEKEAGAADANKTAEGAPENKRKE